MLLNPLKGITAALLASTTMGLAQITDDFSFGHGPAPGGAYSGDVNAGWITPWLPKRPFPSVAVDRDVVDMSPLALGSGNYLVVSGIAIGSGIWGIARQYAPYPNREYSGVRRDRSHVIRLNLRIDELAGWSGGESFTLGESIATTEPVGLGPQSSFYIRAHRDKTGTAAAGSWALYDGARDGSSNANRFVDSGMPLILGVTYTFTIRLRPDTRSWIATIDDGTRNYTSPGLGYRSGGYGTGVISLFREGASKNDFTTFSIDNLLIKDGD